MEVFRSSILLLFLMPLTAGCGHEPEPPDTGARATVQAFYQALLRQDWPAAYALVHPDSKIRCSEQQFVLRAVKEG